MRYLIKLFLYARPYWGYLAGATFSVLAVTALNLTAPLIIRELINCIQSPAGNALQQLNVLGLLLILIYIFRSVFQFFSRHLNHVAAWLLVRDMRSRVYDHLQRLSLRYFQDRQTGDLMSRNINDTGNFEVMIAHAIPDSLANILMLLGVTAILMWLNFRLALLTMLPMPLLVYLVAVYARKVRPAFRRQQEKLGELNATLQDNLSGMREIQAFTQEKRESRTIYERAHGHATATITAVRMMAVYHPGVELLAASGNVIVVWLGGRLVLGESMQLADLMAFLLYLGMFYQPIQTLSRVSEDIQNALAGADRVFALLEQEPEVKEKPGAKPLRITKGRITFAGVGFSYVDGQPVLQDIDLEIKGGETIAIVGPTGVGKTTLVSLLPRFYDPTEGTIFIDGVDIRTVTLASLRSQISLVLQDVFLFNGTVMENILYGRPDATIDQVIAAARAACAHEFIERLPQGYDTQIGERGVKLSGGQKQRLAIARALLRDTPILILDEATSSVDTQTEKQIQTALANVIRGRTTLIIAHRLSTVKKADRIVVLANGRIREIGTHDELLAAGGLYSQLCAAQFAEDDHMLPEELVSS